MSKTTSHFVFLTPGFAQDENDSTTIPSLQVYLKSLKEIRPKDKFTIIAFQFPFSSKNFNWNGIQVISLGGKNLRLLKLWVWKKALDTLENVHQRHPITVLHSFWIGECSFIGQKFSKKYNINHIITVMGQDTNIKNKFIKLIKRSKTNIITLSKNHQKNLLENHGLSSEIIPWSINTKVFPATQNPKIDILGVGSLNKVKNYPLFLKIILELTDLYPKLKVEIIGEGNERNFIEKLIKQYHLEKNVVLTGKLHNEQVLLKMASSEILLHTSSYESFGQVFIEALYSKMFIVSFNVGIASGIDQWKICSSQKEAKQACLEILSRKNEDRKRILLYPEDITINSYLKRYNE